MTKNELITPCYIVDECELKHNIKCFDEKLSEKFCNHIIGYSFKTNSLPRILQIAKNNGCYAEVVSEDEFELAKAIGFSYDRIIYNGPNKTKSSFLEAMENGCIVNIDSQREIDWLQDAYVYESTSVGVRVNFDLESVLPGHTVTEKNGGRFGFCYENYELKKAINSIRKKTDISVLHMHFSNASKSEKVYKELTKMACCIIDEEKLNPKYIDIGGGFFGGGDNGEEYEKYVNAIYDELYNHNRNNVCVIVEPGASIVATTITYLTKVTDVKDTSYGRFVFTDGTRLDIDPFMKKNKYNHEIFFKNVDVYAKQIVCGYTCMENDRIMVLENQSELSVGDYIEYKVVGSYTMSFNNMFINYLPNVYSYTDNDYVLVREKWCTEEYIRKSRWLF